MEKKVLASELALAMGVMCNAIAVSLMIKSELGVSTISSVPVVLNEMFAHVTIGSWNFLNVQDLQAAADGQDRFLLFQSFLHERHFEVVAQREGRADVQARFFAVKIWGNILSPSQQQSVDFSDIVGCRFGGADGNDQRITSRGLYAFHESNGCVGDGNS